MYTLEPLSVSTRSATTTTSIEVGVTPAVTTSKISYYKIRGDGLKCDAKAGPAIPSCELTGLSPGKWYDVSAASCGEDKQCSRETHGRVHTLPEGESFEGKWANMYNATYIFAHL